MELGKIQSGSHLSDTPEHVQSGEVNTPVMNMDARKIQAFTKQEISIFKLFSRELWHKLLFPITARTWSSVALTCREGRTLINDLALPFYDELEDTLNSITQKALEINSIPAQIEGLEEEANTPRDCILGFLAEVAYAIFGEWDKSKKIINLMTIEGYQNPVREAIAPRMSQVLFANSLTQKEIEARLKFLDINLLSQITDTNTCEEAKGKVACELAKMLFSSDSTLETIKERYELINSNLFNQIESEDRKKRFKIIFGENLIKALFIGTLTQEKIEEEFAWLKDEDTKNGIKLAFIQSSAHILFSGEDAIEVIKERYKNLDTSLVSQITERYAQEKAKRTIVIELSKQLFSNSHTLEKIKDNLEFIRTALMGLIAAEEERNWAFHGIGTELVKALFLNKVTLEEIKERLEFLNTNFFPLISHEEIKDRTKKEVARELAQALFTDELTRDEIENHLGLLNVYLLNTIEEEAIKNWARLDITPRLAKAIFTKAETQEEKEESYSYLNTIFLNSITNICTRNEAQITAYEFFYKQMLIATNVIEKAYFLAGKTITREEGNTFVFQGNPKALAELLA